VPLVERPQLSVLRTQRATQLRNHAGRPLLGGRIEAGEASPRRRCGVHEEIGLEPQFGPVVGYLPDHVVMTG
jgi:hypothetical protein